MALVKNNQKRYIINMKKLLELLESTYLEPTEEEQRQADLRQAQVEESLVKLSYREETIIEEETFRFLTIQHRKEKLARRRGLPLPPEPGNVTYAVYR